MGEAKRKAARLSRWESSLADDERLVARAARQTYERFIAPSRGMGMCYRMAFFLSTYLRLEHSIIAPAVVGFVHDGTGDLMASHAWIEFNGKKTDISLTITEVPSVQLQGQLIILDEVLLDGHSYTYHREQSAAALDALKVVAADPTYGPLAARKDREHAMMVEVASDPQRMLAYLNAAPDGFDYDTLMRISGLAT